VGVQNFCGNHEWKETQDNHDCQDAAMKKAIADFMPDVIHRLCIWHIMKNILEKCGSFMSQKHREGMEKKLNELVYDSLSVLEFESGWQQMLKDYDAGKKMNTYKPCTG